MSTYTCVSCINISNIFTLVCSYKCFEIVENDVIVSVTGSDEFLEINFSVHVGIHLIK